MISLKERNKIQEFSRLFLGDFIPISDREDESLRMEYFEDIQKYSQNLLGQSHFFFGNSHDSPIRNVVIGTKSIDVVLDDISTLHLADALSDIRNIKIKRSDLCFPVTLKFEGVSHFSANTVSSKGRIKRRDVKYLRFASEYLYEEFFSSEVRKKSLALNIWIKPEKCGSSRWLLLIECEAIIVAHDLRKSWEQCFGKEELGLFDQYWEDRLQGKVFSDYSNCLSYLKEKIA